MRIKEDYLLQQRREQDMGRKVVRDAFDIQDDRDRYQSLKKKQEHIGALEVLTDAIYTQPYSSTSFLVASASFGLSVRGRLRQS